MSLSRPTRRIHNARRPTRDDIVGAQYEDGTAAADYAATYEGWGPASRYYHSRLHVVDEALRTCSPGTHLLDVGCGPGMLVRHLLDTRPDDFHITACDRSQAMIDAAAERSKDAEDVDLMVARIEDLPFEDGHFDVVVAMGVLEYTDVGAALREIARVVRPDGLVVVTMLNPASLYRLFEWCVYRPALRLLGRVERLLGVARHDAPASGIRAVRLGRLRRMLRDAGLSPQDAVHYDVTMLLPPLDRPVRRRRRQWRDHPERTVSRGALRKLGTAYLVTARRGQPSAQQ